MSCTNKIVRMSYGCSLLIASYGYSSFPDGCSTVSSLLCSLVLEQQVVAAALRMDDAGACLAAQVLLMCERNKVAVLKKSIPALLDAWHRVQRCSPLLSPTLLQVVATMDARMPHRNVSQSPEQVYESLDRVQGGLTFASTMTGLRTKFACSWTFSDCPWTVEAGNDGQQDNQTETCHEFQEAVSSSCSSLRAPSTPPAAAASSCAEGLVERYKEYLLNGGPPSPCVGRFSVDPCLQKMVCVQGRDHGQCGGGVYGSGAYWGV